MMPLHLPISLACLVAAFCFSVGAIEVSTAENFLESISFREAEAWTLDGRPLYPMTFHGLEKEGFDARLSIALDNLLMDPMDGPAKHAWHGRRLAYLWKHLEAISVCTTQLPKRSDYAPPNRHRGHSCISTRNFTKAQRDLQKAADPITAQGDVDGWEPDGKPNRHNLPLYP